MERVIWLDDIRCPHEEPWRSTLAHYVTIAKPVIHWVKSYNEFVNEISDYEDMPIAIFFDHDLGDDKSGMDCMKWFIDYMQDNNINPNEIGIYVQSANPVGRENISSFF